jgi:hypothetical protein
MGRDGWWPFLDFRDGKRLYTYGIEILPMSARLLRVLGRFLSDVVWPSALTQ